MPETDFEKLAHGLKEAAAGLERVSDAAKKVPASFSRLFDAYQARLAAGLKAERASRPR